MMKNMTKYIFTMISWTNKFDILQFQSFNMESTHAYTYYAKWDCHALSAIGHGGHELGHLHKRSKVNLWEIFQTIF